MICTDKKKKIKVTQFVHLVRLRLLGRMELQGDHQRKEAVVVVVVLGQELRQLEVGIEDGSDDGDADDVVLVLAKAHMEAHTEVLHVLGLAFLGV